MDKPIFKRMREVVDTAPMPPVPTKHTELNQLIADMLHSVSVIHIMHLNTKDYELHKTLDEYYKNLPELVDVLAEASIGLSEEGIPLSTMVIHCPNEMIDEFMKRSNEVHKTLPPALTNALEDIMTFMLSIKYKLRFQ